VLRIDDVFDCLKYFILLCLRDHSGNPNNASTLEVESKSRLLFLWLELGIQLRKLLLYPLEFLLALFPFLFQHHSYRFDFSMWFHIPRVGRLCEFERDDIIELGDCLSSLARCGEFNESKSLRLLGIRVLWQAHMLYGACSPEYCC